MVDVKDFMITDLVNEDGTPYDPPRLPEYLELKAKYPRCENWGYGCMFCNKCLLGDNFKPEDPEEEKILLRQGEAVRSYFFEHNPSIKERLSQ